MLNEKNAIAIAIANCKGGVAKTASTAAIGGSLAHRGNRVLFVDLDCQGNLSHQCMESVPLDKVAANIFAERKVPTVKVTDYIDIVPTDDSLNEVEHRFTSSDERFILTKVLRKVSSNYDYILFDCPPALNWITLNAFVAADQIIVPMKADRDSLDGLSMVSTYCYAAGGNKSISGIFFTMFERNIRLSRKVEDIVRTRYADTVFSSAIRKCSRVAEARDERKLLIEYAPDCTAAQDYEALVDEILARIAGNQNSKIARL